MLDEALKKAQQDEMGQKKAEEEERQVASESKHILGLVGMDTEDAIIERVQVTEEEVRAAEKAQQAAWMEMAKNRAAKRKKQGTEAAGQSAEPFLHPTTPSRA